MYHLYFGWLMAYTYGSMHATSLQVHAGIIVTPGVKRALFPKAPINAITPVQKPNKIRLIANDPWDQHLLLGFFVPYGVHDATNRKHTVIAAFAIRTSAVSAPALFDRKDSTFIFFACSLKAFSCSKICETI